MNRLAALILGIAAWAGVAALAVVTAFTIGDRNQVLMFMPILLAVVAAWGVGEAVTERVFSKKEGM